jgi:hypothetical protein
MRWSIVVLCLLLVVPAAANAQGSRTDEPRVSVTLAGGSHLYDGGDVEAVALGFSPNRWVTLLLNLERNHVPTDVDQYADGYSATRGGTVTTASGEVQVALAPSRRFVPFAMAGTGAGRSRPNVNDLFPDPVENSTRSFYLGGGVRVPVGRALAVSVDAKVVLLAEAGEAGAMLPIRVGIGWRF